MHTFFHGWRRKAGCVTLVMACVFAGVLTRSLVAFDRAELTVGSSDYSVVSTDSLLVFMRQTWVNGMGDRLQFDYETRDGLSARNPYLLIDDFKNVEWRFRWAGLQLATGTWPASEPMTVEACIFPIWMLIVPLTLLSAYLILWKPRKRA